jgi:hypothetical protein
MKSYFAACLAAATASAFITLGAGPASGSAVELAATAAWPVRSTPMAHRAERGWLLRAMSRPASAGTLTSVPNADSNHPRSL